ncbi:MAG: peptidase [bacterium]|nr:peptidase [bacterium]
MFDYIDDILARPVKIPGKTIGYSREDRPLDAAVLGHGKIKISLIAGCHADEPVGPRFLGKLYAFLDSLNPAHELLANYRWWLVPHANPDGEAINKKWYTGNENTFDMADYLEYVERELPGEDVEFGFPYGPGKPGLRPENDAVYNFWMSAGTAFHLHASLHGMMTAAGPWFLLEKEWIGRSRLVQSLCREETAKMNYILHDVDRKGEKGFSRISEGFCTRPDSRAMRAFFLDRDDPETAGKFFPSSMEAVRSLGGDPLTIVSEMPLFILPDLPAKMDWPNPVWEKWHLKLQEWKDRIRNNHESKETIRGEIRSSGIIPMPVTDQMRLQWRFITAAVKQVEAE